MRTIYKYPLELVDLQTLELPAGAELLTVQMQDGRPCLWAEVATSAPARPRTIAIYGTGNPIPGDAEIEYIGTFQMHGGALVFHAFEVVE
jgi:hypothetical protein